MRTPKVKSTRKTKSEKSETSGSEPIEQDVSTSPIGPIGQTGPIGISSQAASQAIPIRPGDRGVFIQTIQGGVIKSLFDSLKDIVHDVVFRIDSSGIRLLTMDKNKCALVHLKLDSTSFEQFVCEPLDATYELSINILNVFKLIKSTGTKDVVTLMYDSIKNPHTLGISIQNFERNSTTAYDVKLLDLNSENIELNDVEFDSVISMPSTYFQRMCRDMSELSETVRIGSNGRTVSLSCDGDYASQCTTIGQDGDTSTNDDMSTETSTKIPTASGTYSLKYLVTFCKASNLCPTVEISLREDFLILHYKVASLGSLRFCLVGLKP